MTEFVLVPGAWLGAWVWADVRARLEALGHTAHPVTLSGLAERAHIPVEGIGLDTHVDDILAAAESCDSGGSVDGVVLVGHSYAGIPTGIAASRLGDRLRHVVFVDANLPAPDRSMLDGFSERGQAVVLQELEENNGHWLPLDVDDLLPHGFTKEQAEWLVEWSTPHPGRTLQDQAALARPLSELPATYILCQDQSGAPENLPRESWNVVELAPGHWPMVTAVDELVTILTKVPTRQAS